MIRARRILIEQINFIFQNILSSSNFIVFFAFILPFEHVLHYYKQILFRRQRRFTSTTCPPVFAMALFSCVFLYLQMFEILVINSTQESNLKLLHFISSDVSQTDSEYYTVFRQKFSFIFYYFVIYMSKVLLTILAL